MKENSLRSFAAINAPVNSVHCLSDNIIMQSYLQNNDIITRSGTRLNSILISRVIHINTKFSKRCLNFICNSMFPCKKMKNLNNLQTIFRSLKEIFFKRKGQKKHSLHKDNRGNLKISTIQLWRLFFSQTRNKRKEWHTRVKTHS